PYRDVPALCAALHTQDGTVPRALEWLILSVARTGEVLGAEWSEIDLAAKVWTIPGSRMKAAKAHRVPLSDRGLAILADMQKIRRNEFVFPGSIRDALAPHPMLRLLRRMQPEATVHGMRSAFRDWAREQTNFPREVAEMCLAHAVGNSVEQAYARGDA